MAVSAASSNSSLKDYFKSVLVDNKYSRHPVVAFSSDGSTIVFKNVLKNLTGDSPVYMIIADSADKYSSSSSSKDNKEEDEEGSTTTQTTPAQEFKDIDETKMILMFSSFFAKIPILNTDEDLVVIKTKAPQKKVKTETAANDDDDAINDEDDESTRFIFMYDNKDSSSSKEAPKKVALDRILVDKYTAGLLQGHEVTVVPTTDKKDIVIMIAARVFIDDKDDPDNSISARLLYWDTIFKNVELKFKTFIEEFKRQANNRIKGIVQENKEALRSTQEKAKGHLKRNISTSPVEKKDAQKKVPMEDVINKMSKMTPFKKTDNDNDDE